MMFVYEPELTPIDFTGIPSLEPYVRKGFKASTRVMSIEDTLAGMDMVSGGTASASGETLEEKRQSLYNLIDLLVRAYAEWNLSFPGEDGVAPINAASMRRLDKGFLLGLVRGWIRGTVEVSGPLGSESIDSGSVREVSIPMEISTPNQQS